MSLILLVTNTAGDLIHEAELEEGDLVEINEEIPTGSRLLSLLVTRGSTDEQKGEIRLDDFSKEGES